MQKTKKSEETKVRKSELCHVLFFRALFETFGRYNSISFLMLCSFGARPPLVKTTFVK
jgi:hypothetical protein